MLKTTLSRAAKNFFGSLQLLPTDCGRPTLRHPYWAFRASVYAIKSFFRVERVYFPVAAHKKPGNLLVWRKSSVTSTSKSRGDALQKLQRRRCFAVGDIRHIGLGNLQPIPGSLVIDTLFDFAYIFYSQYHAIGLGDISYANIAFILYFNIKP